MDLDAAQIVINLDGLQNKQNLCQYLNRILGWEKGCKYNWISTISKKWTLVHIVHEDGDIAMLEIVPQGVLAFSKQ